MVEQDDTVMAELTAEATRDTGEVMRLSMAEVFVMRGGLICERRAWVIELKENDFRWPSGDAQRSDGCVAMAT